MIYVDEAIYTKPNGRKKYCHMMADSLEELHAFAQKINVGKHFFHRSSTKPHYDLSEEAREVALQNFAHKVSSPALIRLAKRFNQYFTNRSLSIASDVSIVVPSVEAKYEATFVGDLPVIGVDRTCAVFWQPYPKLPEHSNYFGIYVGDRDIVYITNAISVIKRQLYGVITQSNELLYSRYQHDFRWSKDKTVAVDGGSDYFRLVGDIQARHVQIKVQDSDVQIVEIQRS